MAIFFLTFFLNCQLVKADNSFTTSQTINYQIDSSGNATVNHQFRLTNNYSTIYAKEYQLTIPQKSVGNLSATDELGSIIKQVENQETKTIINLVFNQPKLGKDAITNFQIKYSLPNLATQKGKTWEISLPQPPTSQETTLNLELPTNFGTMSFASAKPVMHSTNGGVQQLTFQLSDSSKKISLAFGQSQLFDLKLSYYLENPTSQTITKEIPIPPNTESQSVIYQKIDPPPSSINIDTDGNWLASYQLNPGQKININISGQAKIVNNKNSSAAIDSDQYLKPTTYWPITDSRIASTAAQLPNAAAIYDFVVKTLEYDYNRLNQSQRRGAILALDQPLQSLCTDFTDLFISLARAKGIPAREIQGYAYSNNPKIKPINTNADILHAWPQYYEKTSKSWKSIDPTWGKTTNGIDFFHDLDLNHITFVIHGTDDRNPPPPGSFRSPDSGKTVEVSFANQEIKPDYQRLQLRIINADLKQINAQIYNPNLFAVENIDLSLDKQNWSNHINLLPPLASVKVQFPSSPFQNSISLSVKDNHQPGYQVTSVNKIYYLYRSILIGCLIILLSVCGIIITSHR